MINHWLNRYRSRTCSGGHRSALQIEAEGELPLSGSIPGEAHFTEAGELGSGASLRDLFEREGHLQRTNDGFLEIEAANESTLAGLAHR